MEFKNAADAYLHRQDANPAKAFLEAVEGMFGAEVAQQQRTELWNWIRKRQK